MFNPDRTLPGFTNPMRHRAAALAGAAIAVLSLATAGALALPAQALGQTPTPGSIPATTPAPAAATPTAAVATATTTLNFQQVVEGLAKLGYKDVREIERKGEKLYEVKARDPRGAKIELTVDARSGEVLREKADR